MTPGRRGFFGGVPVVVAVGVGAVTYCVALAVTYVLAASQIDDAAVEATTMEEFEIAGWLFYGGHSVDIDGLDALGRENVNFLHLMYSEGLPLHGADFPQEVFYLVPMVGLYVAGLACVRWIAPAGRRLRTLQAGKVGIPLALGYGLSALVGAATVFSLSTAGETIQPSTSITLVMMGVVYPVVVGGIGGALGSK